MCLVTMNDEEEIPSFRTPSPAPSRRRRPVADLPYLPVVSPQPTSLEERERRARIHLTSGSPTRKFCSTSRRQ